MYSVPSVVNDCAMTTTTGSLKILLAVHVFFPKHFYGTETYTLQLAKSLEGFGHRCDILTSVLYGEEGQGSPYFKYEYDGLTVHCTDLNTKPLESFGQMHMRPDLYPLLKNIISDVKPDIVHVTHLMGHTSTLLEVLRDLEIPTVATLTDFFGICPNSKLEGYDGALCLGPSKSSVNCLRCYLRTRDGSFYHPYVRPFVEKDISLKMMAWLLPYIARLPRFRKTSLPRQVSEVTERIGILRSLYDTYQQMVAPTDFLYEAYSTNSFYPHKLRKINFGIDLNLVRGYQAPRKKTDSMVRFGYIGQITSHKGVDLLITAYAGLMGDNKALVVYGPADQDVLYMEELLRLSSGLNGVEFLGTFPREELASRLSELDVLVIPSRWYENSPLVLLYALATRTPVIVTDVKGMSEFVLDGFNGYTFKKDSSGHLLSIMQKVVDDPACIERFSENANYSKDISDHAREVVQIYEDVLAKGEKDLAQITPGETVS